MTPEEEKAVASIRMRARDFRTHIVYLSLLQFSPVLAPLAGVGEEVRGEVASRLAHAIANELDAAASYIENGGHHFDLWPPLEE